MTPRPYRMARRQESTEQSRRRILQAARELLAGQGGTERFSLEEVARRAGVARMTVYYQFGSLGGLLTALCDSLALAGGMSHLADAFRRPDPLEALDRFIEVFAEFWDSDREVMRRLGAMAALDPEFAAVLEERYGWRRRAVRALVQRLPRRRGKSQRKQMSDAADLLYLITSFSAYDTLAGTSRSRKQVTSLLQQLARETIG